MRECIFCKIAAGDIPANKIYEDDELVAFKDIRPQAPVHDLIIPKEHIPTINDLNEEHAELIGKMVLCAKMLAERHDVTESGYRLVLNCNEDAGQEVFHIHLHLFGGRKFAWPPG